MADNTSSEKLAALRSVLEKQGLDGLLVQRADLFQGEEVRPCDERLAYISGFTGSAGYALILKNTAALFSDQRYSLQMQNQTDAKEWQCFDTMNSGIKDVIADLDDVAGNIIIGYDSWIMTAGQVEKLLDSENGISISWVALRNSLIDEIWQERPDKKIIHHWYMPDEIAGISAQQKITQLYERQSKGDPSTSILVSKVDSVNWLLNVRGDALAHTPFFHAMLLVHSSRDIVVISEDKPEIDFQIEGLKIEHRCFTEMSEIAKKLVDRKIQIDKSSCPKALLDCFLEQNSAIEFKPDSTVLVKAQKNEAELKGMKDAHIKDAVAFCQFWYWFENAVYNQPITECEVATYLSEFRAQQPEYICDSFPAIVGFNDNGAIVHYRAKKGEDSKIENNGVVLIDSGAHYKAGTTDITRCFAIAEPAAKAVLANSLVVGAHLTLSNAIFPKGVSGIQLDAICRQGLWDNKMDYGHGTGHGVGHVLSVHEGPASLSKRGRQEILAGMILSNEPGYYQPGEFGIRQENLVHVITVCDDFLGFENLTFVPFDKRLIDTSLLSKTQLDALNSYHKEVLEKISPHLPHALQEWLDHKCEAL